VFPEDELVEEAELADVELLEELDELDDELEVGVGLDVFPAELEEELDGADALVEPDEPLELEPSQLGVGLDTFPADETGSSGRLELVELGLSSTGSVTCPTVEVVAGAVVC